VGFSDLEYFGYRFFFFHFSFSFFQERVEGMEEQRVEVLDAVEWSARIAEG